MIFSRVAYMQAKDGQRLQAMSDSLHIRSQELPAERGNIYTEKGALLCSALPKFDVHVDFSVIEPELFNANVNQLAEELAKLFDNHSKLYYKNQLKQAYDKKLQYWALGRNISYDQYQSLRDFPIFNQGKYKGGFIAERKEKRVNPYGMLAYRAIGLWRANARTVGMEHTYDTVLSGMNGSRIEQKMPGGWMPVKGSEIDPQRGRDIVTTIDLDIQGVAEHAVKSLLEKHDLQYGTCIVMEVETGKVRAMVNLGLQEDGTYWEDYNYALMPTEPGSVFKLATLASLLNDKYITIDDMIDVEGGQKRFGNQLMKDSHFGDHEMTILEAFAHSSNVAHAKLVDQFYNNKPEQYLDNIKKLHLHEKTGIDLAGERSPVVKSTKSKSWNKKVTLPWMATGYSVQITPLQTCMLYNAVANNGKMMRPYLISEVKEYGKTVFKNQPKVIEESIGDSATIAQLQTCVKEVGETGTAKGIKSPFYSIAGKTGTAQVADKGIKYSDGVYQGSFVGYFPADAPRYTIAVVMRTKRNARQYYGSTIAAPVFRMIADRVFAAGNGWDLPLDSFERRGQQALVAQKTTSNNIGIVLGSLGQQVNHIAAEQKIQTVSTDTNNRLIAQVAKVYKGYMPDVAGMALRDAVYLLEKEGLVIHIKGKGKVRAQSVAPGTLIKRGQTIVLELS